MPVIDETDAQYMCDICGVEIQDQNLSVLSFSSEYLVETVDLFQSLPYALEILWPVLQN